MSEKPIPEVNETSRPYWDAAQREELVLPRNKRTGRYFLYPRPWAPDDYSSDIEWVPASGEGKVVTFTVTYFPLFESYASELPYIVAVIKLAEGPTMMANILNCKPEDVYVGMRVKVTFEERKGGFKVVQFEPA
jgi:uncharacterized OB-fold protein